MNTRFFRVSGKCHEFDISRCQDQIKIFSDSDRTTIVLCDGAGNSPYGGIAANIVSDILVKKIHNNFEEYLFDFLPDIKRQLAQFIDKELSKVSKELGVDSKLLATTILAICMDKTGKFVGVHLGDGTILWNVNCEEDLQIVSSPQNGFQSNSTYLTMNCPLFYYLRFYRWQKSEAKRIILLSDGMNCLHNEFTSDIFSSQNQKVLHRKMIETKNSDDMSYVLCELSN